MKYFAEFLGNLNYISLSIDVDSSRALELQQCSQQQLLLTGLGYVSKTVHMPVDVENSAINEKLLVTSKQIRLPPQSSAKDIESSSPFKPLNGGKSPICRCGSPLVGPLKWRQLPSEHWAELMDLWHCHKPTDNDNGSVGIYELAMNGFHPKPGLAYFSDTYYLVHAEDVLSAPHLEGCKIKSRALQEQTLKVWKWELSIDGAVGPVISLMLQELVDAHAVFTFTINSSLIIWVLNASTRFTYTGVQGPLRGAKVLYGEADELSSLRPDAEPIELPAEACRKLVQELEDINSLLPMKSRKLGKWKLGLLGEQVSTAC